MQSKIKNLVEINDGTNNKIYKGIYNNKKIILKKFSKNKESIKKNVNEFKFTKTLYKNKINSIAKPVKTSKIKNYSVYEFLKGKKIKRIKDNYIIQCAKFINQIQFQDSQKLNIPFSRDSCLSLSDHLNLVNNKLNKILLIKKNKELKLFINNVFEPSWLFYQNKFKKKYSKILNQKILKKNLIISPSDFNFNNILLNDKKLFFFDFEYSGFDDCKKLICDFICQPEVSINNKHKNIFINAIKKRHITQKNTIEDLIILHKFKWCLILLNVYISSKIKKKLLNKIDYSKKSQLKKSINYFNKNKLYKYGN